MRMRTGFHCESQLRRYSRADPPSLIPQLLQVWRLHWNINFIVLIIPRLDTVYVAFFLDIKP